MPAMTPNCLAAGALTAAGPPDGCAYGPIALRGKIIDRLLRSMSPPDKEVLQRQDVRKGLGRSLAESFRQGIGAATWDGVAVARREGFGLQDIRTEVLLWHGERGRNDPVAMARL
jgi:hypothetical protein